MYRCFECCWKLLPCFSRLTQLYCHRTRIWMIRTESGNCFNSYSASFSFPNRKLCARIKRDKRNGDLTISIPQTVEEMVFALSAKNFLSLSLNIKLFMLALLGGCDSSLFLTSPFEYWRSTFFLLNLNRNLKIFFMWQLLIFYWH